MLFQVNYTILTPAIVEGLDLGLGLGLGLVYK